MSGFLVEKWVCTLERFLQPQNDCLGGSGSSPFRSGPPSHGGLLTSFVHASMWAPLSRHHAAAPHAALELKALRAATRAATAAARATGRLLYRARTFLLSGAVVSVPAAAVARAYDDTLSAARSVPSTVRIAAWAVRSGLCYKRLMALYSDHDCEEYVEQLQSLHTRLAHTLVQVSSRPRWGKEEGQPLIILLSGAGLPEKWRRLR